jgi:mRNA-degrading endonuclease YafQ of YafQ-DinJ toxin-antitoxin module
MHKLIFTHSYEKRVKEFLKKNPKIEKQYVKTLELLEINPFHPSLRLHKFSTRSFEGYSVSINMSYRISLEFLVTENEILLINIGDHQEIYGKK